MPKSSSSFPPSARRATTIRGLVFLCWPLLCCLPVNAAPRVEFPGRERFDVWTTENGLPQNSVNAIVQTRDGYLWLATMDGLARFDGVRFTVFNKSNTQGIRSNRFTALCEDREGNLWIGTEDGGLLRYRDQTFTAYTTAGGPPGDQIVTLHTDHQTPLLVHTRQGVSQWDNGQFIPYFADDARLARFKNYPAALDAEGGLWMSDQIGFYRFTPASGVTAYPIQGGLPDAVHIPATYRDRRGAIWLAAAEVGVFKLQNGELISAGDSLPPSGVNAFCEGRDGAMWMATGKGLLRYANGALTTYTAAHGLSSNQLLSVYEDAEGSLWIGTVQGGLNVMRNELITVLSTADGLSANNIYPLLEDRDGSVWVGAWPGLNKYKDGKFTTVVMPDGSPFNHPSALFQDRDGYIWVGTYGNGAHRFKAAEHPVVAAQQVLPRDAVVHAIHQDRAGALWFGTAAGLTKYEGGVFNVYTTRDGLPHNRVNAIVETRDGALWLGTRGGLARFKDGRFTRYTEAEGLSGEQVRAIYEDREGALWIGTYDGGLTRWQDGVLTKYTTEDGLFDYGVFQILEDGRGDFWISCNRGIYRVSRRELNDFAAGKINSIMSIAYGKRDGLVNIECNGGSQPAGVKTRDGQLWFPTQGGVAVIDPQRVETNHEPPPVWLEQLVVNNDAVALQDHVRLLPGQEVLEIHYSGVSFINPEQIKFKYKLEGLDRDWIQAGTRRTAYYSHLPPGDYHFTVLAANRDGVWNTVGASVKITVVPPFWRTWWFLLLALLSVGGLILFVYYRRVSQLQKAHAAQESFSRQLIASQEHERERIAAELHDSLGQNLLIIKNRAFMGRSKIENQSATLAQLDEISAAAALAVEEVREIAHNLRPYQLDRLGLTMALEGIVNKISSSSAITFTADIDPLDQLFSPEAEINLYRIVQESLNNIIKHSAATAAHVRLKRDGRRLLLRIEDNGRGFMPEAAAAPSHSNGFGLASIRERARILGGTCAINSAPGQGTVIQLSVNLPDERHMEHHDGRSGE